MCLSVVGVEECPVWKIPKRGCRGGDRLCSVRGGNQIGGRRTNTQGPDQNRGVVSEALWQGSPGQLLGLGSVRVCPGKVEERL